MRILEIDDQIYDKLVKVGKLIEHESRERNGKDMGTWEPESVISYLLGAMSVYDPGIHKIVFPGKEYRRF